MGIGELHAGELHKVIDEMLAVAPADLDDDTLHDDVIELQAVTARLAALKASRVAEWARRSLWNSDGSTCASSRLAAEAGLAPSAARDEIRRANALAEMPATAAALAAGDISVAHVELLARANSAGREGDFARDEDLLVEDCTTMAFDDAHHAVDYWMLSADESGAEAHAARRHARRGVSWRRERDGALVLRAVLDPVAAVAVDEELHRLEHQLYLTDQTNGATRTPRQRGADALVEMATRSA
nr:13E12 repeat family protein [Actinomycetota bacterium]